MDIGTGAKELFKDLIKSFFLTIVLRMVNGIKVKVNLQGFAQSFPELGYELDSAIIENMTW